MTDKNIPDEMKEEMNSETNEDENGSLNNTEHDLDAENLELLDPQLVEKLQEFGQEDMLVEFDGSKQAGSDDRMELASDWFTEKDDYRADTNITPQQVYAMTMLRNVDEMFPELELEETQSWVDDVLDDVERYVLSIEGFARRQEENILRAMFGDTGELDPQERDSMFMKMLSNPGGKDKED